MGIKGTVRRTTDGHLIHANIDTDIIISEETPTGSTKKPEELYRVIERFAQGSAPPSTQEGWLTETDTQQKAVTVTRPRLSSAN